MDSTTFELVDGKVVMKSQSERVLTRNEVMEQINYAERRKQELIDQSQRIKEQFETEENKIQNLKFVLEQMSSDTPTTI